VKNLKSFIIIILVFWGCKNHQDGRSHGTGDSIAIVPKEPFKESDDERLFNNLNKNYLFKILYDNPVIDNNGEAAWTPNYYERMNLPVSYDKKCHTGIDTIMYYSDNDSVDNAVVIFRTYDYISKTEKGGTHCYGAPIGIALFTKEGKAKWELYKFSKGFTTLGLFGGADKKWLGKSSLMQTGDKWTCLSLEEEDCGNGGYDSKSVYLYSIEPNYIGGFPNSGLLTTIISYHPNYSNMESDDSIKQNVKTEIRLIKKHNSYYDIDLITTGHGNTGTKHYKYSEEDNNYIEKK
jgi:hypothetical protein